MALTAIIYLQKPFILVSGYSSIQGITTPTIENLQVGTVAQAYMGSYWTSGTIVLFSLKGVNTITDASGTYFMVNEKDIFYYEAPLP